MTLDVSSPQSSAKGVITGRHVLFGIITFFAVIITVNVIMVRFAINSFPGEEMKKSYVQGLKYNEVLDARAEQASLGWTLERETSAIDPRGIQLRFVNAEGAPITGAAIAADVGRPTTDDGRFTITFDDLGGGVYRAVLPETVGGAWDLDVAAVTMTGTLLTAEMRVVID